ncbi:serine/threonine-protein kinase [Ilumatobacter sp.]|uniref:serine/threonine-protein kinase n=1 Tax=Ilumatobacter sp. TaxID=1967498 RepID=UPI003751B676
MPSRSPASPPVLPGFEAIELIGSGGYADVFLYRQQKPERLVAMKVLVPEAIAAGSGAKDFTDEANLMAKVSAHPYIVQVFQADIAPDGRPFLAMEYYPGADFYDRAKREQMTVAEVLRTGVQLASAVETAHRANIFHRDIKPANVLTSEFHRPGLTDFGIASAQGPDENIAEGLSIPWAPPEAFGESATGARADVYSLAATLYTMLVGRSPFEIPGGDNSPLSLMSRVERNPVPRLGRADVPPSFERVLDVAMAKMASHRPETAAEFGRQLQGIESELRLSVTPLELAGEARSFRSRTEADNDDTTRVKGITEIVAQPSNLIRSTGQASSPNALPQRHREGVLGEPEVDATVARAPQGSTEELTDFVAPKINRASLWVGGVAATIALIVAATFLLGGRGSETPAPEEATDFAVNDGFDSPVAVAPPPVEEIVAVDNEDGSFTFSWIAPSDDVEFIVSEDGGAGPERISETSVVSFAECVEVETVATSGLISAATRGCA